MKSKLQKKKVLITLIVLLNLLLISSFIFNHNNGLRAVNSTSPKDYSSDDPKPQELSSDNTFSGIGQAWNITHWANRTDTNLPVNFDEGNTGETGIPLYSGWEANTLESHIYNLYDTRNWNNGTFSYGPDNGYSLGANDSTWIQNSYQNWNFDSVVVGQGNVMSGNYIDSAETSPNSLNHDCLELRMAGNPQAGNRYWYDQGDGCWWDTTFHIPRGELIDSVLKFQVNPIHLLSFNSWEMRISINNVLVFSIGIYSLKGMGVNTWLNFSIPQGIWINTTNVFSSGDLNDTNIPMRISLEYTATSASYGPEDGVNRDYQQILFDNVELVTTAEARPSDLQLKLNGTDVNDSGWGSGDVVISGTWQGDDTDLIASFSADDVSDLGTYSVQLLTNLNLFAFKTTPDSNYETNEASLGAKFSVVNESDVNWLTYGKVKVPTRYEEYLMRVEFPDDMVIQSVFEPQNPTINKLNLCDNSTAGVLNIDIPSISATPDGFWKFIGRSPNYCDSISFYNNKTGSWELSNQFLAGEYVNITAEINNSPLVSSYLLNTQARLQIRFPNGSLWDSKERFVQVGTNGLIQFETFQIPGSYPFYQEGNYQAIIGWNNTFASNPTNESGLIIKNFDVIHDSILIPESNFYEDNFQNSTLNLKVSYSDYVSGNPIRDAFIYTYRYDNPTIIEPFGEISPGYYFLEFNLTGAINGNNTLNIYANSTYFENKIVSITIGVINKTELTLSEDFIGNVQFKQNFTIQVDYLDNQTGSGISGADLFTNWQGDYHFLEVAPGKYNLTCNASGPGYVAGNLYSFDIFADSYKYQPQSASVRVFITELDTIMTLEINGTPIKANDVYVVEVSQAVNLTVEYRDILGNHLDGASINVTGSEFTSALNENPVTEQYSIILEASTFGQGIDNFMILAQKDNYKPNSIPFIFQIIERQTYYEIFLNGENVTNDPTIDLSIGTALNVTFKYYDINGAPISGATVSLSGDYSDNLIEGTNQYSLLIDTSNFKIGVSLIKISVSKTNYEFQSADLRIQTKRITLNLQFVSGSPIIPVKPGKTALIQIELLNPITNQSLIGANVTYNWIFGKGQLLDTDNNGIYEASIGGVQEGTYTIIISVAAGDEYDFKPFEITLVVVSSPGEVLPFQIILAISIIGAILVGIYLTLYLTILKYPKPIRRVRKYSRTLRKSKVSKTDIVDREKAFRTNYSDTTGKSSKFLKGKPSTEESKIDKLMEKTSKDTIKDLSGESTTNTTGGENS